MLDDILIRMRDSRNITEAPLGMTLAPSFQLL